MCGIIAVLRRRSERPPPEPAVVEGELDALRPLLRDNGDRDAEAISAIAVHVEAIDTALAGPPGIHCLLRHPEPTARILSDLDAVDAWVQSLETYLDAGKMTLDALELERTNAALAGQCLTNRVRVKIRL